MSTIPTYTKASVFFGDITDTTVSVTKEDGFTLQQFGYECSRQRDMLGMPYGPTLMSVLRMTVKTLPDGYLKELYKRLTEQSVSSFSIVFNASFRQEPDHVLDDYDQALVVTGFVIDVGEDYHSFEPQDWRSSASSSLMMTHIEFLLQSITYMGTNSYQKKLYINY